MKHLYRWSIAVALAAFFIASPALAQWNTLPIHSLGAGRGPGFSTPNAVGPCLSGVPFVGGASGLTSDPICSAGGALGTFAFQNYATPPAIGGTTPNTGAFTTLTLTTPLGLAYGGLGASQAAAALGSVPMFPGSGGAATPTNLTTLIDQNIGGTIGSILTRSSLGWILLTPGTAGYPILSGGVGADLAYNILGLAAGGLGGSQAAATVNQVPIFPGSSGAAVPGTITAPIINYTAPGTGGTVQTLDVRLRRVVYPTDYGAVCDSSTDDTTALQNAINATATYGVLHLPRAVCAFTGTLTLANAITIKGSGITTSGLIGTGGATQSQINITTNDPVQLEDFTLDSTSSKTGGYGITFAGSGGSPNNTYSSIRRVGFSHQTLAIYFAAASYWTVENCTFSAVQGGDQVLVRNTTNPDSGDSYFRNNWFFGGDATTTHLRWQSSGGFHLENNKFLGNGTAKYGAYFDAQGTVSTGIIFIRGNSFDGLLSDSLVITTAAATNVLTDISILGNIFDGAPTSSFLYFSKFAGSTLSRIALTANTFIQNSGAIVPIQINDATGVAITGNHISVTGATAVTAAAGANGSYVGNYTNGAVSLGGITTVLISTDVGGLGTGVATFLATPSSANLAAAVTNETGSGAAVFATSPSLVTPNIGTASGSALYLASGNQAISVMPDTGVGTWIAAGVDTTNTRSAGANTGDGIGRIIMQGASTVGFTFQTSTVPASGAVTWVDKLFVTNAGNVGIGASPATTLEVVGAGFTGISLKRRTDATTTSGALYFDSLTSGYLLRNDTGNLLFNSGSTPGSGLGSTVITFFSTGGVNIGAPTGGDKGAGTINIQGTIWTNGTQGVASQTCTVNTASALTLIFTNGLLTGGTCNT